MPADCRPGFGVHLTRLRLFAALAPAAVLCACAAATQPVDLRRVERSASPNDALACPPAVCRAKADFVSPDFPVPRARLEALVRTVLPKRPRTELVGRNPALGQWIFVQRSAIFRFPDTVRVQVLSRKTGKGAASSVIVYSRSNYGYSDMGVNKKRVRMWLDALVEAAK